MSGSIPPIFQNPLTPSPGGFRTTTQLEGVTPTVFSFNGRTGNVVLASKDVTDALGYNPANTASPTFTGTPAAPTATKGDSSTQIATTAFVQTALTSITSGVESFNSRTGKVTLNSADVTGALSYTPVNAAAATTFTNNLSSSKTPSIGDDSTLVANTAFVQQELSNTTKVVTSFNGSKGAVTLDAAGINTILGYTPANLVSPTFTGSPKAPTATKGTANTTIATTQFVSQNTVTSFNSRTGAVTFNNTDWTSVMAAAAYQIGTYFLYTGSGASDPAFVYGTDYPGSGFVSPLAGTWRNFGGGATPLVSGCTTTYWYYYLFLRIA